MNRKCGRTDLRLLQEQINPHFLYNTLDSVRGLAYAEGADSAAEMAEALAAFFGTALAQRRYRLAGQGTQQYKTIFCHSGLPVFQALFSGGGYL